MAQKLIILRGAPASGKTTICKNIRDINKNIVWLSIDGIKPIFSEYKDETLDQANKASLAMLEYLLDQGYSVIYDGIFKIPEHLRQAEEVAKKRDIPFTVYQLNSSLKTLQEREKVRDGVRHGLWKPLGDELVAGLYRKVQDNPIEEAISLDTESKSLDECLAIIRKSFD